jgi:hypothetical protein
VFEAAGLITPAEVTALPVKKAEVPPAHVAGPDHTFIALRAILLLAL